MISSKNAVNLIIYIHLINFFIPSIEINSKFLNSLYLQNNFSTNHFDLQKLLIFFTTFAFGFNYLENSRTHNINKYFYTIIFSLLFFFTSGITVLTGQYDYENFCDASSKNIIDSYMNDGYFGFEIYKSMTDFKRIYSLKIFNNFFNTKSFQDLNINMMCVFPGLLERLITNSFFILSYFLGLNFDLKFTKTQVTFILGNILFYCYTIFSNSPIKFLIYAVIYILAFVAIFIIMKKNKLKISAANMMILLIPIVNIHCLYSKIILGLICGLMTRDTCINGKPFVISQEENLELGFIPVINLKLVELIE